MRLTLRTLLAYIDGILDPADHESLAKQVESSQVASDLMHRTSDTTRRLRLPAPPLADDPSGFDANAVAEYLDNTASPQAVEAFERHCLESDSHLAEAASCHHILTMVLGERADVNPETRRRMYAIPEVAEAIAQQATSAGAVAATAPQTEAVSEVPEYLRGGRRSDVLRWLPAVAAVLLLAAVGYQAFRPGGWLNSSDQRVAAGDGNSSESPSAEQPAEPVDEDPSGGDATLPSDAELPDQSYDLVQRPPSSVGDLPDLGGSLDRGSSTEPLLPLPSIDESTEGVMASLDANLDPGAPLSTDTDTPAAGDSPPASGDLAEGVAPQISPPDDPAAGAEDSAIAGESSPPVAEGPAPVGLFASPGQVLLRYQQVDDSWRRLPARTQVLSGDRLLSLPTYHPTITLEPRLNVELVDGALVEVASEGAFGPLQVKVEYGRVILSNPSGDVTLVRLTIGDLAGEVTLEGLKSLAIDAARPFVPGADPATELAPMRAVCLALTGGVTWSSLSGELKLGEPGVWRIVGDSVGPLEPIESENANWVDGRKLTSWESQATGPVESRLLPGEPIWPQLMEVFGTGLREQSALAAVSSAHVGHFDPFIKALAEPDQRNAWNEEIRTLRAAMSRQTELAVGVRRALTDLHGPERANDLYTMLCGFSQEQVGQTPEEWKTGPLRDLLDWMASPHLEYRVLANYNLEVITGRERIFNPAGTRKSRGQTISKFQARLESGKLVPSQFN